MKFDFRMNSKVHSAPRYKHHEIRSNVLSVNLQYQSVEQFWIWNLWMDRQTDTPSHNTYIVRISRK
jgi:hypothetical protein